MKIFIPALVLFFFTSCKTSETSYFLPTFVKKYPKSKPFVYKTNINLIGNFAKNYKLGLSSKLRGQLEDSINPKVSQKLLWQTIKHPPVYDTSYVNRSIRFMRLMLHSSGYFSDSVWADTILKTKGDQQRVIINFNVRPGPVTKFDSVWYNLRIPELQRMADSSKADSSKKEKIDTVAYDIHQPQPLQKLTDSTGGEALLHKGSTFSQDTIAQDFDRLVTLFRNNGYYRFSREGLIGVWDTLDVSLLKPAMSISEQIELLDKLAKRRQNPSATLEIELKPGYDSANLVKFYVGKIYIRPDFGPDSTAKLDSIVLGKSFTVVYSQYLFKTRIFPQYIYMRRGDVYSQNEYLKTISRFNSLVAWRLVNIIPTPRPGTDTIDFEIRLVPARKYLFTANLEGSRNDNNLIAEGNLLGIGVNATLQNRNFAKAANQENFTVRYGTELSIGTGKRFVNSRQLSIGYNIVFPRFVPRLPDSLRRRSRNFLREARTLFAVNYSNTQRVTLYNLNSFSTSFGWENPYHNILLAVKPLNIEYSLLDPKQRLIEIFNQNPGLRNIFNDGLIASFIVSATVNFGTKKSFNTAKINWEQSGLLASLIKAPFIQKNLYRYIKTDMDFKHVIKTGENSELVSRVFLGVGVTFPYTFKGDEKSRFLPFFKAYGAGGPNSMRGWGLRRLGPGSTVKFYAEFPDRFGDMQFEGNLEYRFFLANLFGYRLNSALFADLGNVWFLKDNPTFPQGNFRFSSFARDLAVDVGTGLRVDLGFFLIRLDYAIKARDPSPEPDKFDVQYKWFPGWRGNLQFAVTYPF